MADHQLILEPRVGVHARNASPQGSLRLLAEAALSGLDWLATHQSEICEFFAASRRRAQDPAWKYLLEHAPNSITVGVVFALEIGVRADLSPDQAVGELFEVGFTSPRLVEEVSGAVDRADISDDQKDQLQRAISDLSQSAHHLSVPMFINTLEGMFWRAAQERGLVERDQKGKWQATHLTDHPGKRLGGVESLFAYDELGLDESFESFLRGLVYGGVGHPYRHGTPTDGWRLRSLCLFAALIGWLECEGLIDGKTAIRRAFMRGPVQSGEETGT